MNAYELLAAAYPLVSNLKTWCTRVRARDINDNEVPVTSTAAQKFCSKGAMMKVLEGQETDVLLEAETFLMKPSKDGNYLGCHYTGFNDTRPYEDVIKMWGFAMAEAAKVYAQEEVVA